MLRLVEELVGSHSLSSLDHGPAGWEAAKVCTEKDVVLSLDHFLPRTLFSTLTQKAHNSPGPIPQTFPTFLSMKHEISKVRWAEVE